MSLFSRARVGALLSLLVLLSACSGASAGTSKPSAGVVEAGSSPEVQEVIYNLPEDTNPVEMADPEEESGAVSPPEQPPVVYDFSQPVPEREPVDNTYFADAAFVGDSRTDGLLIYSGVGCGENLTSNGLSIFKLAEKKALKRDGVSYTLLEALDLKDYGKVYLSLGVNELGTYDDEGFYQAYCAAIDAIRVSQPDAVIYIQGLIPLNEEVAQAKLGKAYLRNDHLLIYNNLMKKAAQEKQVAFLDLNPYFADETGTLPAEATGDGVHLKGAYYKQWLEYLKTHTVEFDTLYPEQEMIEE